MILNQIGKTFLIILCVNDFNMRSITSEIYFRDLNWIQEKQKNEPKKKKNIKNKNPISSTHFKALERGWFFFFLIKRISLSIKIFKILARWANIHFCVNKKNNKKNTPLNAIIRKVSRDPFLFVLINTYDSKVSNNNNNNNNNNDNEWGFFTIWACIW